MKVLTTLTVSGGLNMASSAQDTFTIGTPLEHNDGNVDKLNVYANAEFFNTVILGSSSVDTITVSGSFVTPNLKLNGSQVETAWTSYTPIWTAGTTNPSIGNGTIEGYYKIIGKTCFVRGNIAMGSTTTFGSGEWYVSMPVTASHADAILMTVTLLDNSSAWYNATMNGARAGFNGKAAIQYQKTSDGTAGDVNATNPFTWTNSDRFIWNGSFEIA